MGNPNIILIWLQSSTKRTFEKPKRMAKREVKLMQKQFSWITVDSRKVSQWSWNTLCMVSSTFPNHHWNIQTFCMKIYCVKDKDVDDLKSSSKTVSAKWEEQKMELPDSARQWNRFTVRYARKVLRAKVEQVKRFPLVSRKIVVCTLSYCQLVRFLDRKAHNSFARKTLTEINHQTMLWMVWCSLFILKCLSPCRKFLVRLLIDT